MLPSYSGCGGIFFVACFLFACYVCGSESGDFGYEFFAFLRKVFAFGFIMVLFHFFALKYIENHPELFLETNQVNAAEPVNGTK